MTCIAAVTDGTNIWMGGDSAGIEGWDLTVRADPKVFRSGPYLIGFTTSFRMGQILRYGFTPPIPAVGENLFAFMATKFVDAVRDCLKAGGYAERDKDRESAGVFLAGIRGRLFRVDDDYHIGESADLYDAVGCGHAYAKGAMYASEPLSATLTPPDKVGLALGAAERHSAGVRGPFVILSTEAD